MNTSVSFITISSTEAGQRLDNYLLRHLKGVPRSHIYRLLRRGEVRINRGRCRADYRLQAGDLLRLPPVRITQAPQKQQPNQRWQQVLQASILYQDARLLVLNKPAGMAVHGGSGLDFGVIETLRLLLPQERELELVHRLDRETSGCLLISKRRSTLRLLHQQLREHQLEKRYWALLAGAWPQRTFEVKAPLHKNSLQSGERIVRVDPQGKPAITRFVRLKTFSLPNAKATLVEAQPITGRTHQIRVHAAYLGHPILGDEKYGSADSNRYWRTLGLKRLFLHARTLTLPQGDQQQIRFEAPLEPRLEQLLTQLDNS